MIKNPQQWFMDDDKLTKQLCQEDYEEQESGEHSEPCRACDEAKYEVRLFQTLLESSIF